MDKKEFEEDLLNLLKKQGFVSIGISGVSIDLTIGGSISVRISQN